MDLYPPLVKRFRVKVFNLRRIFNSIDLQALKANLNTLAALFIRVINKFKPLYGLFIPQR